MKRGNFLPTFLLALLFWLLLIFLLISTSPESILMVFTFYLIFFLASFLTFSLLLANSRRGFILASGLTLALLLQQAKMANFLNLTFLVGILLSIELYFSQK